MKALSSSLIALACAAAPALAETTFEVSNSWTAGSEAAAKQVFADRMAELGYIWEDSSIAGYENAQAAFAARIQAGDAPEARAIIAGEQGRAFYQAGIMAPIDSIYEDGEYLSVLPEMVAENIQYKGHFYNAPTGVHGQSWYFYSIPAMEKIGVAEQPADWDGFFAMLDKAAEAGLTPVAWSGQSWQMTAVWNQVFLATVGQDQFNALYSGKDESVTQTPEFARAVEIFGRLKDYIGQGTENRSWNDATAMVIRDEALLQFQPDWAKGEFMAAGEEVGTDFGCAVTPGSQSMMVIVDSFSFPKVEGAEEAQLTLAKVILEPEVQKEFAKRKGAFPARTDIDMSEFDACTQTAAGYFKRGQIAPNNAMTLTPDGIGELKDLIAEFWADGMDTEEFGERMAEAVSY